MLGTRILVPFCCEIVASEYNYAPVVFITVKHNSQLVKDNLCAAGLVKQVALTSEENILN